VKHLNLLRAGLHRDDTLFQQYQAMFHEQLQVGIIELVPEAEKAINDCFFLPHHGDKLTTKLHIVFDGSAKSDCDVSLNDCLFKGVNHTPLVFDTLIRFKLTELV